MNICDTQPPAEKGLNLRPQDKSKEIVPPLRYTFRGDMERIYDQLNNKAYPSVQKNITAADFTKKMKRFKRNFRTHLNHKSTSEKKFLHPKNVFSDLHKKTHFKAAYTIYLNYNSCLQDKAAKELRKEEDMKEAFYYPQLSHRTNNSALKLSTVNHDEPYKNLGDTKTTLRKSYNDTLQRTYEDFELETDDSVVVVEKHSRNLESNRMSYDPWGRHKMVKSLSPDVRSSLQLPSYPGTSPVPNAFDLFRTRGSFMSKKENLDSAKENFRSLKNKAKGALEKCDFLRRKHFKGDTLHKGEGKLFMTKGLNNSLYQSTIVRASP